MGWCSRKASGKPGISCPEALDEALCFGWIDGLHKNIDENSDRVRFAPQTRPHLERGEYETDRRTSEARPGDFIRYEGFQEP